MTCIDPSYWWNCDVIMTKIIEHINTGPMMKAIVIEFSRALNKPGNMSISMKFQFTSDVNIDLPIATIIAGQIMAH